MTFLVRVSGRILINIASLNTQGGAGTNFIEITKVPMVIKKEGDIMLLDAPAISGNMLKHYHFVNFVTLYKNTLFSKNLTRPAYLAYVANRFPEGRDNFENAENIRVSLKTEEEIVKNFADADVHGFLAPKTGVRRESPSKFSFFIPVEETIKKVGLESIVHNRVDIKETGEVSKEGMMIFRREYSSALFGFLASLDLKSIGTLMNKGGELISGLEEERKERMKATLIATGITLTGEVGANRSRALPAWQAEEVLVVASKSTIPPLIHGFYKDYAEDSLRTLANYSEYFSRVSGQPLDIMVYVFGRGNRGEELEKVAKDEGFKNVVRKNYMMEIFSDLAGRI